MESKNRRQMMISTFRYSALSIVGFLAGSSMMKRRRLIKQGRCIEQGICHDCRAYDGCRLPQALLRKEFLSRKKDDDRKN